MKLRTFKLLAGLAVALTAILISSNPVWSGNTNFPGTDEGARKLLLEFSKPGADCYRLTWSMQPTVKELDAYFVEEARSGAFKYYDKMWLSNPVMCPSPTQTQLTVFKTTSDDLKAGRWTEGFPGGYKNAAKIFNPGFTIYAFKWTEPGKQEGFSGDGLTFINGGWVILPKPWRILW